MDMISGVEEALMPVQLSQLHVQTRCPICWGEFSAGFRIKMGKINQLHRVGWLCLVYIQYFTEQ